MRATGLVIAVCFLAASGCDEQTPARGVKLFTEEQAREIRLTDEEWDVVERQRGVPPGPRIVVHQPEVVETDSGAAATVASPFDFIVLFEANQAAVDMETLDIFAKRRLVPIKHQLTPYLLPFINGDALRAREVETPRGRYLIHIAIADAEGRLSETEFRLHVR